MSFVTEYNPYVNFLVPRGPFFLHQLKCYLSEHKRTIYVLTIRSKPLSFIREDNFNGSMNEGSKIPLEKNTPIYTFL